MNLPLSHSSSTQTSGSKQVTQRLGAQMLPIPSLAHHTLAKQGEESLGETSSPRGGPLGWALSPLGEGAVARGWQLPTGV